MALTIMSPDYSDESLANFALRRKKELEAQVSALRGQLAPKEAELTQINKLLSDLGILETVTAHNPANGMSMAVEVPSTLSMQPTIKDYILSALRDHFREGATPAQIRDYIKMAYGKEIDRGSISPQLSRLRDEGEVFQSQHPSTGTW